MANFYGFKKQKDNNPNSPTYNQERWVRDTTHDGECAKLKTPQWIDTKVRNCSTSDTVYTPSPKGSFGWKEQRDGNPYSDTVGTTRWVRDASYDGTCQSNIAPNWVDTKPLEQKCSTSATEYIPV